MKITKNTKTINAKQSIFLRMYRYFAKGTESAHFHANKWNPALLMDSDDFDEMERQSIEIASWADNVYVKIPIINTKKQNSADLIKRLTEKKVKLNITAIMPLDQIKTVVKVLNEKVPSILSVFAGRIADTGRDPIPLMKNCLKSLILLIIV